MNYLVPIKYAWVYTIILHEPLWTTCGFNYLKYRVTGHSMVTEVRQIITWHYTLHRQRNEYVLERKKNVILIFNQKYTNGVFKVFVWAVTCSVQYLAKLFLKHFAVFADCSVELAWWADLFVGVAGVVSFIATDEQLHAFLPCWPCFLVFFFLFSV